MGEFEHIPNTRSWSTAKRTTWWVKMITMAAGAVIALAGATRVLGVKFDIETATDAVKEHELLQQAIRDGDDRVLQKVGDKIDKLSERVDAAMLRRGK